MRREHKFKTNSLGAKSTPNSLGTVAQLDRLAPCVREWKDKRLRTSPSVCLGDFPAVGKFPSFFDDLFWRSSTIGGEKMRCKTPGICAVTAFAILAFMFRTSYVLAEQDVPNNNAVKTKAGHCAADWVTRHDTRVHEIASLTLSATSGEANAIDNRFHDDSGEQGNVIASQETDAITGQANAIMSLQNAAKVPWDKKTAMWHALSVHHPTAFWPGVCPGGLETPTNSHTNSLGNTGRGLGWCPGGLQSEDHWQRE